MGKEDRRRPAQQPKDGVLHRSCYTLYFLGLLQSSEIWCPRLLLIEILIQELMEQTSIKNSQATHTSWNRMRCNPKARSSAWTKVIAAF